MDPRDPLKVLKSEEGNIRLALKAFKSGRSKDGMRYHLCFLGHNSLKVKIGLKSQSQDIISLNIHRPLPLFFPLNTESPLQGLAPLVIL